MHTGSDSGVDVTQPHLGHDARGHRHLEMHGGTLSRAPCARDQWVRSRGPTHGVLRRRLSSGRPDASPEADSLEGDVTG